MAKVKKVPSKSSSQEQDTNPWTLSRRSSKGFKLIRSKQKAKAYNKEWDDATCSVCMEYPHNAVLLLCSSYDKGCRPYMCATGRRYSNCLEQYKKAYMKVTEIEGASQGSGLQNHPCVSSTMGQMEVLDLLCPLCRGQVKGCTVVEAARKYLNSKKRTCMQEKCTFSGIYKDLRRHVKAVHPSARPRAVDPALEEKWKRLEQQRERNDVISTIISTTPGAVVLGDYVIEHNHSNPFFVDYGWDNYSSDEDLSQLESLSRDFISPRMLYSGDYDMGGDDLSLHRSRSSRIPFASSRTYRRILSDRFRRRRRHGVS